MRRYICIGIGGSIGAIARYIIKNWQILHISDEFHLDTVVINITGCFILALFLRLAFDIWELDSDFRLGIATGFIGAFTTFSTFCREIAGLFLSGDVLFSLLNLIFPVMAGLTAIFLGDMCAKKIIKAKDRVGDN